MSITYDELKKIASKVRAELVEKGVLDVSAGKIRRKPRTDEKLKMLYIAALNRLERYKPYREKDGTVILPYFCNVPLSLL